MQLLRNRKICLIVSTIAILNCSGCAPKESVSKEDSPILGVYAQGEHIDLIAPAECILMKYEHYEKLGEK